MKKKYACAMLLVGLSSSSLFAADNDDLARDVSLALVGGVFKAACHRYLNVAVRRISSTSGGQFAGESCGVVMSGLEHYGINRAMSEGVNYFV